MKKYEVILDDGHESIGTFVENIEIDDSDLSADDDDDDDDKSDMLESDILKEAITEKAIAQFRHKFGNSEARKMFLYEFYEIGEDE